jgi:hypothetical protein
MEEVKRMTGRCKDCRYAEAMRGELHCELVTTQYGEQVHPESLARAVDPDEYSAWLVVRPDFGCVQFAPKTEASDVPK